MLRLSLWFPLLFGFGYFALATCHCMPTYTYSLVSAAFAIIPLSLVSVVFATKYAALWLLLRLPLATVCLHIYSLISVAFATTYDMYAAPWLALRLPPCRSVWFWLLLHLLLLLSLWLALMPQHTISRFFRKAKGTPCAVRDPWSAKNNNFEKLLSLIIAGRNFVRVSHCYILLHQIRIFTRMLQRSAIRFIQFVSGTPRFIVQSIRLFE